MRFGLGYRPDTHDKSKDVTSRALLGAHVGAPGPSSLEKYGEIHDQGPTSACVGFAFAQAVRIRCRVLGMDIPWPSPVCPYTGARALARQAQGLDPSTPLTDDGSEPTQAATWLQQFGIPSDTEWPFDPNTINDEADLAELEFASASVLQGLYRIPSIGAQRALDIKQALANDYPVVLGTQVDEAFMSWNPKIAPAATAPVPAKIKGGHMLCVVAFLPDGRWRVANSWGTGPDPDGNPIGDHGIWTCDEAWIESDFVGDVFAVSAHGTGRMPLSVRKEMMR